MKKIITLIWLSVMFLSNTKALTIQPKFASITANGATLNISVQPSIKGVKLKAGSQLSINDKGEVYSPYTFDAKNCKTWVVAIDTITGLSDTCKISVVPWTSNLSSLKIEQSLNGYKILGKDGDTLFVNFKGFLYKTGGDLSTLIPLAPFQLDPSDYYWAYLRTPAGSFMRVTNNIYFSKDDKNWSLDYTTKGRGIRNSFSYTYDSINQTTHVFAHDYAITGADTFRCAVYRKTISPINLKSNWEKAFVFYSQVDWAQDKSLFPACRHIHTLVKDPYTGHLWIGTGDANQHSHIYYSEDNGSTWRHIGMGSQEWRVLSIWFTKDFVYWSMDSSNPPQKIFRIPRTIYNEKGYWPDMSEKLTSGYPKNNVYYMILSNKDHRFILNNGTFQSAELGDIIWGNQYGIPKPLIDENNSLISLNDPTLDYRELVTSLSNSALWCNTSIFDKKGDVITIMEADCTGQAIDNRARVFGIKECIDKTVDVQELISVLPNKITKSPQYTQLYPYEQDALGNIYFQPFNVDGLEVNTTIKTTLDWHDNSLSKGGEIEIVKNEIEKDTSKIYLKLKNYDGKILKWQSSKSNFIWSDIQPTYNNSVYDTISIHKEKNKIKYIRAIIQKDTFCPVASNYIKIDSLGTVKTSFSENLMNDNQFFTCYPNPTENLLYIQANSESLNNLLIELFSIEGSLMLTRNFNSIFNKTDVLSLTTLPNGLYILKITDKDHVYKCKVMKNYN